MINRLKALAYIPARSGSKRIPGKNIKNFCGKPLIAYSIEHAKSVPFIDRIIVDTNSEEITGIAKKYGAEVPFLRPSKLAHGDSKIIESILYTLNKLETDEKYLPTHLVILQTTSPLRDTQDIMNCWDLIQNKGVTTVTTVCATHPKFYHLGPNQELHLVNGDESFSTNTQDWQDGYMLNGSVFIVEVNALLREKKIITNQTRVVVCPKWRSIDIDVPEEWVMSELFLENKNRIIYDINQMELLKADI